jgi:NAD(P) transhydrogenase subunit beta
VIVPGYGVALAQAQYALAHLGTTLRRRGVDVVYALHPVAGRMPGQLNVLLDAAGVAWNDLRDLETAEFDGADVAFVVGANDVVNPRLGTPTFEVGRARAVVMLLDGEACYSGLDNPLPATATVRRGDLLELLRETDEAVARVAEAGNEVTQLVEALVQPGDHDRN